MDRSLDYLVPDRFADRIGVGSVVRVPLHGRRVRGWVVELDARPAEGVELDPITGVTGIGPDEAMIELSRWVAWRWAGRLPTILRLCTPDRAVSAADAQGARAPVGLPVHPGATEALEAAGAGAVLLEVSPTEDPLPVAAAALQLGGQVLFVAPSVRTQRRVAEGLSRAGAIVARWPSDFAGALGGRPVVGGLTTVFAPAGKLGCIVIWDEHDEGLQSESSPTWHAREVAVERAGRAGVPCLLVSPCPSTEGRAVAGVQLRRAAPASRRDGWATLVVVDRREEDLARSGLFSTAFVRQARRARERGERVVCVLNRKGRAKLLACRGCGNLAACAECGAAVQMPEDRVLVCGRCGASRPAVCLGCGGTAMRLLRLGVGRAREELEALLREPVDAVTGGEGAGDPSEPAGVVVGTEAALHRFRRVGLVAFLDFDQELLAPRYRAGEEALALLMQASRAVGGRRADAAVLVQTRLPDHDVLAAATRADPQRLAASESARRELLGLPPASGVAAVGGEAAAEFVERLGRPEGVEVRGPREGWWLVRSRSHERLSDVLASVRRPRGRLRLRVDPLRLP